MTKNIYTCNSTARNSANEYLIRSYIENDMAYVAFSITTVCTTISFCLNFNDYISKIMKNTRHGCK